MSEKNHKQSNNIWAAWPIFVGIALVGIILRLANEPPKIGSGGDTLLPVAQEKVFKVLYVDSYHEAYPPNASMHQGVEDVLIPKGVDLRYTYMDAKHKKSPDDQRAAAARIVRGIEEWKPDILIAADDSASKYLVKPNYKNASLPVVFIGVNWDAKQYGYPYSNATGQVEVEMVVQLIDKLKEFSKGPRVGILSGNTLTDRNTLKHYSTILKLNVDQVELVDDYAQWRAAYKKMQSDVDVIILRNNAGINGWDDADLETLVQRETLVPTGTVSSHLSRAVLISYSKSNYEFGEYGGQTAWRILNGDRPSEIPITENKQGKVYLNMKLAKKLGIRFPVDLIQNATLISADSKKVIFVNSYHKGFQWSDDIEKGILQAFNIKRNSDGSLDSSASDVNLKIVYLDTKRNTSERAMKRAALSAKDIIERWNPEVVITSDDNAARCLVEPYLKNTDIPVVFCGVNWDAAIYGFPTENITGMVEVSPVMETVSLLRKYARGDRVGIIGTDSITARKESAYLKEILSIQGQNIRLFKAFSDFTAAYDEIQDSVDMLLLVNPTSMVGWEDDVAAEFILENTRIPTGGISDTHSQFSLLGRVKIAEEQGWWSGNAALKILNGARPSDIMMTTNKSSRLFLNMTLANRLKIKFPVDLMQGATLINLEQPAVE